ncbi:sterol desaturase family protein [Novacetimonas pomaceti]|uniref:Fatty acid hydroxylase n=1 Tax=Novacetimonas pomaceti TaxID=2021998 RepID=A0A318QDR1_9PROT|nr:sterol desaturase family protein [Novacetimonas pomaceti]MBV1834234.1 sterol desaturase family protein [Novacetimonas pomaceti]PYD48751.1 fatty acid hydroxylase [Novacetimonas pomaceti]PYD76710.1 fatty acid hydroxylase [Novacetimonas pomaceti]
MITSTLKNTTIRTGRSFDLGKMNLRQLWIAYLTYPTILLYFALAAGSFAVTVHTFVSWLPVVISILSVVLVYPLVWYAIHRFILHGRFLYRLKMTSALWKRIHFDHHQDPHLLDVLFGSPLNTIPTIAIVTIPIGFAIGQAAGAAAAFGAGLTITCIYEFFHCIQHLNYKPKMTWIQRMKQRHVLHHFHNENGNYGITSFVADRLFRSYYVDAKSCTRSPSVFNLGYDQDEAKRYPWVMDLTGSPPRDRPDGANSSRNAA